MRPTAGRLSMWLALGVGVALATLALVLALSVVARPGDAATKVVTKTFSKAGQVTIPAGAPGTSVGAAAPYPSE